MICPICEIKHNYDYPGGMCYTCWEKKCNDMHKLYREAYETECPICKTEITNGDTYPIVYNRSVINYGSVIESKAEYYDGCCQECWEKQCDESWWKMAVELPQKDML